MLRIVTGPFHPVLDRALVEDIRSCKTDDTFAPLAVIVPSASLVEHLKQLLTRHEPRTFLNIHSSFTNRLESVVIIHLIGFFIFWNVLQIYGSAV